MQHKKQTCEWATQGPSLQKRISLLLLTRGTLVVSGFAIHIFEWATQMPSVQVRTMVRFPLMKRAIVTSDFLGNACFRVCDTHLRVGHPHAICGSTDHGPFSACAISFSDLQLFGECMLSGFAIHIFEWATQMLSVKVRTVAHVLLLQPFSC
jgi:hypothetical protein